MARFLVQITVNLPPEMPAAERADLVAREGVRGRELKDAGIIRDVWRVPGRFANAGIWEVGSATALHDAIASLPLWPWLDVVVTPLANHALTTDPEPVG